MFKANLYIASQSPEALSMARFLRQAMARRFDTDFEFSVIHVLENPVRAEADRVLATPTVIRFWPEPEVRIIGGFDRMDKVLEKLGIKNGTGA